MKATKIINDFKNTGLDEAISAKIARKFMQFKNDTLNDTKKLNENLATKDDIKELKLELKLLSNNLDGKIEKLDFKIGVMSDKIINRMFVTAIAIAGGVKALQYFEL